MPLIKVFNNQTTPDLELYDSKSESTSSDLDVVIRRHTQTSTTVEVVSTQSIIRTYNQAQIDGLYYFLTSERPYLIKNQVGQTVKGYILSFETNPILNAIEIQGYLLKQGKQLQNGLFNINETLNTLTRMNLQPTFKLTSVSTRKNKDVNDNQLNIKKYDLNMKDYGNIYTAFQDYLDPYLYGTHLGGYLSIADLGVTAETLQNIENELNMSLGNRQMARQTEITLEVFSQSVTFKLQDALDTQGNYIFKYIKNKLNDNIGVQIGDKAFTFGVIEFGAISSDYATFKQKNEIYTSLGILEIMELLMKSYIGVALNMLPGNLFSLPPEYTNTFGYIIGNKMYGDGAFLLKNDSLPVAYEKAKGENWNVDFTNNEETNLFYKIPDAYLQTKNQLIQGIETYKTEQIDLKEYLNTSQSGYLVEALVTKLVGVTGDEAVKVKNAFKGGIRIV